jgi:hypothetical protein
MLKCARVHMMMTKDCQPVAKLTAAPRRAPTVSSSSSPPFHIHLLQFYLQPRGLYERAGGGWGAAPPAPLVALPLLPTMTE